MITSDELIPEPREYVLRNGAPDTIAGWKALVDGLLTDQACAFHRNLEISSRYAWMYKLLPDCFKWAGMAAFASHHVRYALFPFRLDTDRTGYVDIPHSLGRRRLLLLGDVLGSLGHGAPHGSCRGARGPRRASCAPRTPGRQRQSALVPRVTARGGPAVPAGRHNQWSAALSPETRRRRTCA